MEYQSIDWHKLRRTSPHKWRKELWENTLKLLTSSDEVYLSDHNNYGYFHKVIEKEHFKQMKNDWKRLGRVPLEWISKGQYPGVWTAMFDACNTYSLHHGPLYIVRFYFKNGYRIYDENNQNHKNLLDNWNGENETNPWDCLITKYGYSLKDRISYLRLPFPTHKKFLEDHKFGAAIGYSDYVSPVILLEDSVESVEFSEILRFGYFS